MNVRVWVKVKVLVKVRVFVGVFVAVGVKVLVGVCVDVGVLVKVLVLVQVKLFVGVKLLVGVFVVVASAGTGDLVSRTTNDIEEISYSVRYGVPKVLIAAVRAGMGREAAHEVIKEHAVAVALAMREKGRPARSHIVSSAAMSCLASMSWSAPPEPSPEAPDRCPSRRRSRCRAGSRTAR